MELTRQNSTYTPSPRAVARPIIGGGGGIFIYSCSARRISFEIVSSYGPALPHSNRASAASADSLSVFFYPAEYLLNINCFNSNSSLARVSKLYGFVYATITKEFKVLHALVFVICFLSLY
jgi:hypothetical protein